MLKALFSVQTSDDWAEYVLSVSGQCFLFTPEIRHSKTTPAVIFLAEVTLEDTVVTPNDATLVFSFLTL